MHFAPRPSFDLALCGAFLCDRSGGKSLFSDIRPGPQPRMPKTKSPAFFRITLPATSANLGPAFDAAALAMDFHLKLDARPAHDSPSPPTGRDAEICGNRKPPHPHHLPRSALQQRQIARAPGTPPRTTTSPSAKVAARPPPRGWPALRSRSTSANCAGPTPKSSAKPPAASTIPTTPPPAGWAA